MRHNDEKHFTARNGRSLRPNELLQGQGYGVGVGSRLGDGSGLVQLECSTLQPFDLQKAVALPALLVHVPTQ